MVPITAAITDLVITRAARQWRATRLPSCFSLVEVHGDFANLYSRALLEHETHNRLAIVVFVGHVVGDHGLNGLVSGIGLDVEAAVALLDKLVGSDELAAHSVHPEPGPTELPGGTVPAACYSQLFQNLLPSG